MKNLWILTEERPKSSVIKQIIEIYQKDFDKSVDFVSEIKIKPVIENGIFLFSYEVEGLLIEDIQNIIIKTVSGSSSFLDFLVFEQENQPIEGDQANNLIMAIEETKTSDDESRNTGVYQRGSKFVHIKSYYNNVKLYMLYNDEVQASITKKPSDTNIFGTNILLTLGVDIIGKENLIWFKKFDTLEELIDFKNRMRKPPESNVPIEIKIENNKIYISGRLSKPSDKGNIAHDPNIGALSMISACIRVLGWTKDIIITSHGVNQEYVNKTNGKNKFLFICKKVNMILENIESPVDVSLPESYWHYEKSSEKMADILLHLQAIYKGFETVYENHAGCERGYFHTRQNQLITLPKKDSNNVNLYLPDLVLFNKKTNNILLIEGKMLSTLQQGLIEIENYDSIEQEYIYPYYKDVSIIRGLSIFGGQLNELPHEKVLFYLSTNGKIIINKNAPDYLIEAFSEK